MAFNFLGAGGGALSGAAAGSMFGPVGTGIGAVLGGIGGSNLFGAKSTTGKGLPSYNSKQALQLQQKLYNQIFPQALQGAQSIFNQESGQALGYGSNLYNQAANEGIDFAQRGTAANIANQEAVTPGSTAQRQAALNQINSYIQGQIPQDVQQNINRQVAQNLGGGFNLFSGGGQAPNAFARNIGQTSVGLSQYGLSAAPTWQQLANSMVVSPATGLQAGIQSAGQGASLAQGATGQSFGLSQNLLGSANDMYNSQYQSAFNQYQANQLQNQQNQQLGLQLGQMGIQGLNALDKANYYKSLTGPALGTQAYANQFGPDMLSGKGFYETPAALKAAFGNSAIPAYYSGGGQSGYYNQGFSR